MKITFLWSRQGAGPQWVQWLNGASHLKWQGQRVWQTSAETALLLPSSITLHYFLPWEFSVWNEEYIVDPKILLYVWPKTIETLIVLPFTSRTLGCLLNHLSIGTHLKHSDSETVFLRRALQRSILHCVAGLPSNYWRDVEIHFLLIAQMN